MVIKVDGRDDKVLLLTASVDKGPAVTLVVLRRLVVGLVLEREVDVVVCWVEVEDSVVVVVVGSGVVVVSCIGVVANENHQFEVGNQVGTMGLMVLGTSFGFIYLHK